MDEISQWCLMGNKVFVPNHINILGRKYKIKMLNDNFRGESGRMIRGEFSKKKKLIRFNNKEDDAVNTLCHELSHVFLYQTEMAYDCEHNANILAMFVEDVLTTISIIDEKKLKRVKKKKGGNGHGSKKNN